MVSSVMLAAGVVTLGSCGRGAQPSAEQRHRDANTAAGKLGQAAHKMAVEADKAGQAISRELGKAAHDAREGWKEADRKSSSKK